MSGSNTPPVATPDSGAVTEDGTLVTTGNILSNDTDPNNLALSVVAVNGTTLAATGSTTIVGSYGTLIIQPNGQYTYTLANSQASVRGLTNGQVVPDAFTYTISDGQTYTTTSTQTVTNVISQSEAFNSSVWVPFSSGTNPVVTANTDTGPSGGATTADQVVLSSANSGLYYQTNVSGTYTFSVWVKLVSGSGSFAVNYYQGSTNSSVAQTVVATGTWQRVSFTFAADGNTFSNVALVHSASQSTTGTFEFWGAQLNSGSTAAPYVPTTGSPVTTTVTTSSPLTIGSTLTVDVTGSAPVTKVDTGGVTVGGTGVTTGNVLANDTDGPGKTLSVTAVNGIPVAATGMTTIVGTYGTLVIQANGQYTYTLASGQGNVQALGDGQVVPDAFSYTVSDGSVYDQTTTQTVTNVISQSEAFDSSVWVPFSSGTNPAVTANVAPGPNGGASTADQVVLTSANSGLFYQSNVSGTYTFSVWVKLISGNGNFALNYYKGSTNSSQAQTFVATGTWQQVSFTVAADGSAVSNFALVHTASQSTSGTFEFWGAQLNSGSTVQPYVLTTGSPVTTTVSTTTPLTPGSTLTIDVTGHSTTMPPPVANADTAAVSEDGTLVATGNILTNDTDPNGLTLSVVAVNGVTVASTGTTTIVGTYGTLVIQANGQYTYTLANSQASVRGLTNGQVAPDGFTYTVSDGQSYTTTTTQTVTNLITQSEAFNSSAWVPFSAGTNPVVTANTDPGPNGGTSTADQVVLSSANSGLYFQTSASGTYTFSVWVRLISGNGNFALNYYKGSANSSVTQNQVATSTWQRVSFTFTGDGNTFSNVALAHSPAQSATGTYEFWGAQLNSGSTAAPYVPTTGSAVTTTVTTTIPATIGSTLTVDVTGSAPALKTDTGSVTENGTLVTTGNVLSNDTDGPGKILSVTAVNGITVAATGTTTIVGTYGTLVIQANGQYTYTLANGQANVQALTSGQVVPDAFAYTVSDGNVYDQTTTQTVTNVFSQSEAFDSSVWVPFSSGTNPAVTANVAPGPNGGASSADQVVLTSANSGLYYQTNVSGTYTFSVWVKLVSGNGNFGLNYYKASTNSSQTQNFVATGTWQQVSMTVTADGNAFSNLAIVHNPSQSTTGTFDFWGAQLNSGSTVQPYVPTTGSPVTTTVTSTTPITPGSTLTVNVNGSGGGGSGGVPVATNDTAAVTEDGTQVITGNVLSNDTDPNGKTLTVAAVNGTAVAATGTTTIVGTYGTLVIQANGQYTYTLANGQSNVRSLAAGQVMPDAFSYTVSDGQTYTQTTTTTLQNLITQSESFASAPWGAYIPAGIPFSSPTSPNTLAIASNIGPGSNGGASTADQISLIGPSSALFYGTTVSGQNTFSVWVRLVSGDGNLSLIYYDAATNQYVYQAASATSTWQRISLTFTGDGSTNSALSIGHSPSQDGTGVYEIWGAQLNSGATPGTYVATTGSAVNTTTTTTTPVGATLTVNVTGVTPVGNPDTAAVTVGGTQTATGNLLSNDTDANGAALTVASVNGISISGTTTIVGVYGTLVIQPNGQYTYTLNSGQANVQQLLGGQTMPDSFSYTISDGLTHTSGTPVVSENLIAQSEAFNTSPWTIFNTGAAPVITPNVAAGPSGGASTADQITFSSPNSGVYYQTSVADQYTFSVWARSVSGSATFSFGYYSAGVVTDYIQTATATSTWQRFTFNFYGDNNPNSNVELLFNSSQSGTGTFQFWGAQLNPGTTATSYVPTTGSALLQTTSGTTPATIGSALTVSVSGSNTIPPSSTLNLSTSTQSVIANLATDQWTNALRVLPLGDSITFGINPQNYITQNYLSDGWRTPLWNDFVNNNMLINMVGDQNSGPVTLLDQANAGYPGLTTGEIAARLPGLLQNYQPQSILVMAGTNDANQGVSPTTIANDIFTMLQTAKAFNPAIHVYVSTLIPLNQGNGGVIAPANTAIKNMVQSAISQSYNVSLIDNSNFPVSDLAADGVHPNPTGYALLAQNYYNAILAQQPAGGGSPGGTPNTISASVANLVGGSGNDVLIGNSGPNLIYGGSGNDVLEGNGGNDTLVGGAGTDQFYLTPAAGTVTIQDFTPSQGDYLVFDKIPGLTSASNLTGHVTTSGGNTNIDLSSFGTNLHVVLANYTGSISQSQFI